MAAPPLPHTIAIELSTHTGTTFDPVFKRGSPLPAEARRTYRADQTVRPSDSTAVLPIKFWEVDISEDPQEKWWAGCVTIRADQIKRPITEGSEIELTVKIDKSRKITVEAFVPVLNQSFVEGVYIPDPPSARSQLQQQLDLCFERMDAIFRMIYDADRDDLRERAEQIQLTLEHLAEQAAEHEKRGGDPDAELGPGEVLRKVRLQLAQLEEQLEGAGQSTLAREVRGEARWTHSVVQQCGTESDKQEMERLRTQVDKYVEAGDQRGLKWAQEQLRELRGGILDNQPWFWQNVLNFLRAPGRRFLNKVEAQRWLAKAEAAEHSQNLNDLKEAVVRVWEMQPPDQVELSKQQAAQSGLRA
jgi:molecular chaperone DnaK